MENVGEKIMQARKTKGMTQDTLAQLVNVSRQTVSHWENGRAMPDVATAAQLSKVLDVNFLADEAAEDAAVQSPEAMPAVQEPAQETQEQTDGRFVNPPEQPKQPNQRKRIAVICAAVVIIVAAVIGLVLPMLPKAQAEIELSYPPENAYMMKEDDGFVGWMIHFYSTNVSDVPFTPTYALAKWYEGDKLIGSVPAIDYEYMRKWMESDALVKGEMPLDLYCGTDRLNADRGVFIISGTDANGHELRFSISIDLIHEFPPESEN